jgi:hypothetical protein
VGNSDLGSSDDINHRYLSLTGVIVRLDYLAAHLEPRLEVLKATHFGPRPLGAPPIVLHRKELVNRRPPFENLRDADRETAFNADVLALLRESAYRVITVVIDKLEHRERYQVWRFDPYHYCLTALVERYVLFLRANAAKGDVLAEARGKREDMRLKDSFQRVYVGGSDFVPPGIVSAYLTSGELKLERKAKNVAGLQIADMLAHPSFRATLARRQHQELPPNFGGEIAAILEANKYRRAPGGQIDGWGESGCPRSTNGPRRGRRRPLAFLLHGRLDSHQSRVRPGRSQEKSVASDCRRMPELRGP